MLFVLHGVFTVFIGAQSSFLFFRLFCYLFGSAMKVMAVRMISDEFVCCLGAKGLSSGEIFSASKGTDMK